jgi:hypothetical protein
MTPYKVGYDIRRVTTLPPVLHMKGVASQHSRNTQEVDLVQGLYSRCSWALPLMCLVFSWPMPETDCSAHLREPHGCHSNNLTRRLSFPV